MAMFTSAGTYDQAITVLARALKKKKEKIKDC
jgi:hypothetical protein